MNSIIEEMLKGYEIKSIYDQKNAVKEIMQEIVLCGLSRAGFFKEAAFYGGTALRIFYGLDRFSEDLDFSLQIPNEDFDISKYFPILEKEVRAYGLNVSLEVKEKNVDSHIKSAFLKGGTKEHLLMFYPNSNINGVSKDERIRIKLEVDVNPPQFATFEFKYRLLPAPYEIKLYDASSLFAWKVHAVICRSWKSRIKGRDLYDYVFYLSRRTPLNIKHLKERLIQSKYIDDSFECDINNIKKVLYQRFDEIDYEQAKEDVKPFIKNQESLNIWSSNFFKQITNDLLQTIE